MNTHNREVFFNGIGMISVDMMQLDGCTSGPTNAASPISLEQNLCGNKVIDVNSHSGQTPYSSTFFLFLGRVLNQMGEPMKPKASRIWLARKRSKAKWSLTSLSVNRTNVGGATAAWVM